MQPTQLKNLWQEVLVKARDFLSEGACSKWLDPLRPISLEKNVLVLMAGGDLQRQWVEERYLLQLEEAIYSLAGEHISVVLKSPAKKPKNKSENEIQTTLSINNTQNIFEQKNFAEEKISSLPEGQIAPSDKSSLNRKYTFETFVIGKSNEFAHAAALAICQSPGKIYNPFFIYGGVGLGKTHLMHAIGNRILQTMPMKRLLYVTAEQFTNDLINAIREHKIGAFKNRYRTADVLLVDDVQFLSGKDSTQEEFFHTFNELHNLDKQIVITSDQSPQTVDGIEERLRSRFAWGLCADIQRPDIETRIAILQKKAMLENVFVPPQVITDIARKFDSNVRELEGAFIRVIARATLMNRPFENVLDEIKSDPAKKISSNSTNFSASPLYSDPSLKQIVTTVANHFALNPEELLGNNRSQRMVRPRQLAMFLCRAITSTSWTVIAKFFGKQDHATVMRAYNKVQEELKQSPQLVAMLQGMFPDEKFY